MRISLRLTIWGKCELKCINSKLLKWKLLCNSKLKIVIIISYTTSFSVISVFYRKEYIISVNITRNNFNVYFKGDIVVKLSPLFCGWIESTFNVYLPFILHQSVTRDICMLVSIGKMQLTCLPRVEVPLSNMWVATA